MSADSINLLQHQLATLQAQVQKPTPASPVAPVLSIDDIRQVVKAAIAEEVSSLKKVEETPKLIENLTLLQSIGLCLTEEEQVWLSASDKLLGLDKHLPLFFQTSEGKLAVSRFMEYYRNVYESKT